MFFAANSKNEANPYIPVPLVYIIVGFLGLKDNLSLSVVSKFFYQTSARDEYWARLIFKDSPFHGKERYHQILAQNIDMFFSRSEGKTFSKIKDFYISLYQYYRQEYIGLYDILNFTWTFSNFREDIHFHDNFTCSMDTMPTMRWSCTYSLHKLLMTEQSKSIVVPSNQQAGDKVSVETVLHNVPINDDNTESLDISIKHEGTVPENAAPGTLLALQIVDTGRIEDIMRSVKCIKHIYIHNFPRHVVLRLTNGGYVAYNQHIFFFTRDEFQMICEELGKGKNAYYCVKKNSRPQHEYDIINQINFVNESMRSSSFDDSTSAENYIFLDGSTLNKRLIRYKAIFKAYRSLYYEVRNWYNPQHPHFHLKLHVIRAKDSIAKLREAVFVHFELKRELDKEPNWPE